MFGLFQGWFRRVHCNVFTISICLCSLYLSEINAEDQLVYQKRLEGFYFEGFFAQLQSNHEFELVSATKGPLILDGPVPDTIKLEFEVPKDFIPHLVVREIRPKSYYLLDRYTPKNGWLSENRNSVKWNATTVLKHASSKVNDLSEIGILVRDEQRTTPRLIETVLPVKLVTNYPQNIGEAYYFTICFNVAVNYDFAIKDQNEKIVLDKDGLLFLPRGSCETINFKYDELAVEGWHQLEIDIVRFQDSKKFKSLVNFYHKN